MNLSLPKLELFLKRAKENKTMYYITSQKLMGSRTLFSKLMGSVEPMEPMLTAPLYFHNFHNWLQTANIWILTTPIVINHQFCYTVRYHLSLKKNLRKLNNEATQKTKMYVLKPET